MRLFSLLVCFLPLFSLAAVSNQETLSYIRHQCQNNEQELFMLQQRLQNQEAIIDALRDEMGRVASNAKHPEKLSSVYTLLDALTQDVRKLQEHLNTTLPLMKTLEKKTQDIEDAMLLQSKQIKELQKAMKDLVMAVQDEPETYTVQSGDSLGKIAKKHNTTTSHLKELNDLTKDRIFPGQKLIIPESS